MTADGGRLWRFLRFHHRAWLHGSKLDGGRGFQQLGEREWMAENSDSGPDRYRPSICSTTLRSRSAQLTPLLGIIAPITTLTSADSICHLAEELKDASKWLPRIMVGAAATNFTIGFVLLIVVLFRAGDFHDVIASPTGQPYIAILLNATKSVPGTAVLVAYMTLALLFCATNVVTTSSRQLFSFARDSGVPFSQSLSKVSETSFIPVRAIVCTIAVTVILSLILIGSSLAFNIIASLFGVALLGSYLTSVSTLVYQRFRGYRLPSTQFSLGRYGMLINLATIGFDLFAFVMVRLPCFTFPNYPIMLIIL